MPDTIENLKKYGLAEKEAKVYVACLEVGDSLASDIALKSNLPRTLVYDILERLIDLGLVSYAIRNNRKYFRAADPRELMRLLKEKENSITAVLPTLERMQKVKGLKRPKVEVYEGKEGMKTALSNILRSKITEILVYGSSRSSFDVIPAFMEEWHKQRIKQKIGIRFLYNNTPQAREKIKKWPASLTHARYKFMPIQLESPTANVIYANKVVLQSWAKEPFAVMIESDAMAENQRHYFEELWKIARD